MLLHVQRNGDSGWPRVTGSTKASSAARNPGSISVSFLRPPPELRTRAATGSSGCARRCSSSRIPAVIVFLAKPVATATVETPPQPNAIASVAAHCLRIRSSIIGDKARNFSRTRSVVVASCMRPRSKSTLRLATGICSSYFFAVPYGTPRANGTWLLDLALNMKSPVIYDTIATDKGEERVVNQEETLAAREKQKRIKERFGSWVFSEPKGRSAWSGSITTPITTSVPAGSTARTWTSRG